MFPCSRALNDARAFAGYARPTQCVRSMVGIQKQKSANKKNKNTKLLTPLTKPKKKAATSVAASKRGNKFSKIYADAQHNVSPVVQALEPHICHELYSRFCMSVLKSYGFNLQISSISSNSCGLSGEWNLPDDQYSINAHCSLVDSVESYTRQTNLTKSSPDKTISLIINNVGFKPPTLRKFVASKNPAILMSVFDSTPSWMEEQSPLGEQKVSVEKCLHHQLWDQDIGFSNHKFDKLLVTIPRRNLTQGLSLLLFNRAFISAIPNISAGKVIYQWPAGKMGQQKLTTHYCSTMLLSKEGGKKRSDLYDVFEKQKHINKERLYAIQMENANRREIPTMGQILEEFHSTTGTSALGLEQSTFDSSMLDSQNLLLCRTLGVETVPSDAIHWQPQPDISSLYEFTYRKS